MSVTTLSALERVLREGKKMGVSDESMRMARSAVRSRDEAKMTDAHQFVSAELKASVSAMYVRAVADLAPYIRRKMIGVGPDSDIEVRGSEADATYVGRGQWVIVVTSVEDEEIAAFGRQYDSDVRVVADGPVTIDGEQPKLRTSWERTLEFIAVRPEGVDAITVHAVKVAQHDGGGGDAAKKETKTKTKKQRAPKKRARR